MYTRHMLHFDLPIPASTESNHGNLDKALLRETILSMPDQGMSYQVVKTPQLRE